MKAKRGKCLALVAVLAMVVCAFAIALPADESDAAGMERKDIPSGATIFSSAETIETLSADTTIYLKGAGSVKITGLADNTAKIYLVDPADEKKYFTGMEITAEAGKEYKASGSGIVTTGTVTSYGVSVDDGKTTYYPEGYSGVLTLNQDNSKVKILNGGDITVQGQKTVSEGKFETVNEIFLKNVKSTDGVTVTYTATGASALSYNGTINNDLEAESDPMAYVEVKKGQVAASITEAVGNADYQFISTGEVLYAAFPEVSENATFYSH